MSSLLSSPSIPQWIRDIVSRPRDPVDRNKLQRQNPIFGKLKPYQQTAVVFALERRGRCVLADEMGLGKTAQAICTLWEYRQEFPVLIVCPASVRKTWENEITKWWPAVERPRVQLLEAGSDRVAFRDDFIVISYELLRTHKELSKGGHQPFKIVVLDEAHKAKNHKAEVTKAVLVFWDGNQRAGIRVVRSRFHADPTAIQKSVPSQSA